MRNILLIICTVLYLNCFAGDSAKNDFTKPILYNPFTSFPAGGFTSPYLIYATGTNIMQSATGFGFVSGNINISSSHLLTNAGVSSWINMNYTRNGILLTTDKASNNASTLLLDSVGDAAQLSNIEGIVSFNSTQAVFTHTGTMTLSAATMNVGGAATNAMGFISKKGYTFSNKTNTISDTLDFSLITGLTNKRATFPNVTDTIIMQNATQVLRNKTEYNAIANTQSAGDNTNKIATDLFVCQNPKDYTLAAMRYLGSPVKAITVGMNLTEISTGTALVNANSLWQAVYNERNDTITSVTIFQTVKGNYTGSGYNGIALYTYSGGTLTLVDSTTRSNTFWSTVSASNNYYTINFPHTYIATGGTVLYVVAFYNESSQVTAPSIGGATSTINGAVGTDSFTNNARLSGVLASASIPSSQAISGLSALSQILWFQLN